MKGRLPPYHTAEQQKAAERRAALLSGDVAQVRAWAKQYHVHLFGDDDLLLIGLHEAREADPLTPPRLVRESRLWLEANKARILKEREGNAG